MQFLSHAPNILKVFLFCFAKDFSTGRPRKFEPLSLCASRGGLRASVTTSEESFENIWSKDFKTMGEKFKNLWSHLKKAKMLQ